MRTKKAYHSQCMTERELEEAEQWIEAYQKELQELEANRTLLEQQLEGKERKDTEQIAAGDKRGIRRAGRNP